MRITSSTWQSREIGVTVCSVALFELALDGDRTERTACTRFVVREFPQYAEVWQRFVVPMTKRDRDPSDIRFRPQAELDAIGRPEWHVAVAQLHYTLLLHLVRALEIRERPISSRDLLIEAMSRLAAALDNAFELLGRYFLNQGAPAWDETAGRRAREAWLRQATPSHSYVSPVRNYRNALVHGRARVLFEDGDQTVLCPPLHKINSTGDWRKARKHEAVQANDLVASAWALVLRYLRTTWEAVLLPDIRRRFPPAQKPLLPQPKPSQQSTPYYGGSAAVSVSTETQRSVGPGSASYPLPAGTHESNINPR